MLRSTYIMIRRGVVFVLGASIVLVGVVMVVTPGPAIIVIPAGLALLATEFLWARRLLTHLKERITNGDYFSWGRGKRRGEAANRSDGSTGTHGGLP
jgi:uncharacterized protein (TIGR02611 family)